MVGERSFGASRRDQGPRGRNIALLSQRALLFPHMSVLSNVAFGLVSRGVDRATAKNRARALLTSVGMRERENQRPAELSGGQQQRVSLARALATEPDVLLLDEPLAAMDVSVAPSIRSLIAGQVRQADLTTVIVTHDLVDVLGLAARVIVFDGGAIVEDATVEDFIEAPVSDFGSALTGVNLLEGPGGEIIHARETDLLIQPIQQTGPDTGDADTGDAGTGAARWVGTVEKIEIAGGVARVSLAVTNRSVTVATEAVAAASLLPGEKALLLLRDRTPVG